MDFDTAKENIQPLRGGRRPDRLETALLSEKEMLEQERKQYEEIINNYEGVDPLQPWYEYISWIEQSFPSASRSGLNEVVSKCIVQFEADNRYKQDRRLIKLFIKYIDTQENPQQLYQQLYNNGIGTMVADLYIAWSYYYDALDDYQQTEAIFRKGLNAGAQPYEELVEAHKAFSISMSRRMLYNDETSKKEFQASLDEKRNALTTLRAHKKKFVGSIRTGIAVISENPGTVKVDKAISSGNDENLVIHQDDQPSTSSKFVTNTSIIKSIVDPLKKNENIHEPGPWSKAKLSKKESVFAKVPPSQPNFNIMEDDDLPPIPCKNNLFKLGAQLASTWVSRNKPQTPWPIPIVIEEPIVPNAIPCYDKFLLYPNAQTEISLEELRGYQWFKRCGMSSAPLVMKYDEILSNKFETGVRIPPGFVSKTLLKQDEIKFNKLIEYDDAIQVPLRKMFNGADELSIEELLAQKFYRGEIKLVRNDEFDEIESNDDMDMTIIGDRRQSVYPQFRKSFVPRKSILRKSIMPPPVIDEEVDDYDFEKLKVNENTHRVRFEDPAEEKSSMKRKLLHDCEEEEEERATKTRSVSETPPRASFSQVKNDIFKPPPPPVEKKLNVVFEDEGNETCSTHQFNFFIKAQSVSTPKKTIPKLLPLNSAEQEDECVSPQAPKVSLSPSEDAKLAEGNECAQPVGIPKQLSTIMEVTETTHSTKSSESNTVSTVHEFDSLMPKTPLHYAKGEQRREKKSPELQSISTFNFRIPEDQTETIPFNTKLFKLPTANEIKEQLNALATHKQDPKIPEVTLSSPFGVNESLKLNNLTIDVKKLEISHVDLPETEEIALPDEVPALEEDPGKSIKEVEHPEVSQMEIPATQPDNVETTRIEIPENVVQPSEISHMEIPATQVETSHIEIPATQEQNLSHFEVPAIEENDKTLVAEENKATNGFFIYEDSIRDVPPALCSRQNKNNDTNILLHASQKENLPLTEDVGIKRTFSDEFLEICKKSPQVQSTSKHAGSVREVSDLLKFSDIVGEHASIDKSFKNLKIEEPPKKSASPTFNILEEDLNTMKFSLPLVAGKNSTLLCDAMRNDAPRVANIHDDLNFSIELNEDELHRLKCGSNEPPVKIPELIFKVPDIPIPKPQPIAAKKADFEIFEDDIEDDGDLSRSIYVNHKKNDEKEPIEMDSWENEGSFIISPGNIYEQTLMFDVTESSSNLRKAIVESKGNPFSRKVRSLIMEQCNFEEYLEHHIPTCAMLNKIPKLRAGMQIDGKSEKYSVVKHLAKGSFGSVFIVKNMRNNELYAAKQEKPANLWEYYICIELADRLKTRNISHMLPAFMHVHQAIIANNATVLVSELSHYGNLIDVCNKIKLATGRNVDEYVGMVFAIQLLQIIDYLHSCHIIHADIKPDNFLLMSKVEYGMKIPAVQLIDFGSAIDMDCYNKDDVFTHVVNTENFMCCEMKEKRPWTYQTDLFGIAGTIHVIIMGKYMDVEKRLGNWQPKSRYPRYFQKSLWDIFYNTLLNALNCKNLPNLQSLKQQLNEEVDSREKYVRDKLAEFNRALEN